MHRDTRCVPPTRRLGSSKGMKSEFHQSNLIASVRLRVPPGRGLHEAALGSTIILDTAGKPVAGGSPNAVKPLAILRATCKKKWNSPLTCCELRTWVTWPTEFYMSRCLEVNGKFQPCECFTAAGCSWHRRLFQLSPIPKHAKATDQKRQEDTNSNLPIIEVHFWPTFQLSKECCPWNAWSDHGEARACSSAGLPPSKSPSHWGTSGWETCGAGSWCDLCVGGIVDASKSADALLPDHRLAGHVDAEQCLLHEPDAFAFTMVRGLKCNGDWAQRPIFSASQRAATMKRLEGQENRRPSWRDSRRNHQTWQSKECTRLAPAPPRPPRHHYSSTNTPLNHCTSTHGKNSQYLYKRHICKYKNTDIPIQKYIIWISVQKMKSAKQKTRQMRK